MTSTQDVTMASSSLVARTLKNIKLKHFKLEDFRNLPVFPRSKQSPVLPSEGCCHILLDPGHLDVGVGHGLALGVPHDPPEPGLDGLDVGQERLLVVLPVALERVLHGVLAAAHLHGDLHAVGEQVVEVLHPVVHKVPLCPVTDAGAECVRVTQTFSEEKLFLVLRDTKNLRAENFKSNEL